jgi:hypothetical protein
MILDQGREGACTGFGLAGVVNYLRWKLAVDAGEKAPEKVSERMLYHLGRFYDEWPGEDYEGSSCRGGHEGWQRSWRVRGVPLAVPRRRRATWRSCARSWGWDADAARRPLGAYYRIDKDSITDMQAALVEVGAIYASASVHKGWFLQPVGRMAPIGLPVIETPENGRKRRRPRLRPRGYTREGFIVQNSWGPGGACRASPSFPFTDWVQRGTDAWVRSWAPRWRAPRRRVITCRLPSRRA